MLGVMQPVPTSLFSQRMASLQRKTVPWNSPVAFLHQTLKRDGAPKLDNGELLSAKLHPVLKSLKTFPPQGDRCYTASSATDARYFNHQTFGQRLPALPVFISSIILQSFPDTVARSWRTQKELVDDKVPLQIPFNRLGTNPQHLQTTAKPEQLMTSHHPFTPPPARHSRLR